MLLADAEVVEDAVDDLVGGGFAGDLAHGVEGGAKVDGDEIRGETLLGGGFRVDKAFPRGFQRVLVSDVGDDRRFLVKLAMKNGFRNLVSQRFQSFAGKG